MGAATRRRFQLIAPSLTRLPGRIPIPGVVIRQAQKTGAIPVDQGDFLIFVGDDEGQLLTVAGPGGGRFGKDGRE